MKLSFNQKLSILFLVALFFAANKIKNTIFIKINLKNIYYENFSLYLF